MKSHCRPAVVGQICNPGTQETGVKQLPSDPDQPGLHNEIQSLKNPLPVYTQFCFFLHSPIGRHLGRVHCLATMSSIAVEIPIQGLVCIPGFHPLGHTPRSDSAGSCGKPVYLWRSCQTVFRKHRTLLDFHQQCRRVLILHFPTQRPGPPLQLPLNAPTQVSCREPRPSNSKERFGCVENSLEPNPMPDGGGWGLRVTGDARRIGMKCLLCACIVIQRDLFKATSEHPGAHSKPQYQAWPLHV